MQIWKKLTDIYLQIYRQGYRQILSADWTIGRTLHEDLIHGYDDEEESWANVSYTPASHPVSWTELPSLE